MADPVTTNFGWDLPVVGASADTWGTSLNANLDAQDATFGALLSATGNLITAGGVAVAKAAWTTNAIRAEFKGATYTDTSSSGTVSAVYVDAHKAATLAANSAETITNAYGVYCEAPVAGANVTLTNAWALGADSLKVNGNVRVSGVAAITGNRTALFSTASQYSCSTASAASVQCGFGSAFKLTPALTGNVRLRMTFNVENTNAGTSNNVNISYGTGTAPAAGAAATGTQLFAPTAHIGISTAGQYELGTLEFEVTGLTLNTAYWFDPQIGTPLGGTVDIVVLSFIAEEF